MQEEIINRIKKEANLFMVGDVKQSIYKFRLAEPEIFVKKMHGYKNDESFGHLINLSTNFRSQSPILKSVNYMFSKIMNSSQSGVRYLVLSDFTQGKGHCGFLGIKFIVSLVFRQSRVYNFHVVHRHIKISEIYKGRQYIRRKAYQLIVVKIQSFHIAVIFESSLFDMGYLIIFKTNLFQLRHLGEVHLIYTRPVTARLRS